MQRIIATEEKGMSSASLRAVLLFLSLAAAAILAAALVAQFGFGLPPCDLCLLQRYPYVAVIAFGLCGLLSRSSALLAGLLALTAAALALDAGIAWYHAGVEVGLFPGPDACSSSGGGTMTIEEMRRQILEAPLVPCNQAPVRWMGLSIAGWNGVAATVLTLFACIRLMRWFRHERTR